MHAKANVSIEAVSATKLYLNPGKSTKRIPPEFIELLSGGTRIYCRTLPFHITIISRSRFDIAASMPCCKLKTSYRLVMCKAM